MLQHHERADTCDEADADGYRIVVRVQYRCTHSRCLLASSQTRLDLKT